MGLWLTLALQILRRIFSWQFMLFFLLAVVLVAAMYRRTHKIKIEMYGLDDGGYRDWGWEVLQATGLGLVGGLIGSFLMVLVGVSLNNIGIGYLWLLAIFLFLINPRYLCFSYAGGLLSLSYLLIGLPRIEVPQLMGLVAVLHLVESILILFSGHLGALPVYAQGRGQVVGGFTLQRFWPIPLVVMFLILAPPSSPAAQDMLAMPTWWPLIRSPLAGEPNFLYAMMPVVAALGYGDLALTDTPAAKSRWSAWRLAAYSLALLLLSIAASHVGGVAWLAALFGPLGHEYLILKGQRKELRGQPLFSRPANGVMILDLHHATAAAQMGLTGGDTIFSVNGLPVNSREDLGQVLAAQPAYVTVDYIRRGKMRRTQGALGTKGLAGIIFVPEAGDVPQVQFNSRGILWRWLTGLGKKV